MGGIGGTTESKDFMPCVQLGGFLKLNGDTPRVGCFFFF